MVAGKKGRSELLGSRPSTRGLNGVISLAPSFKGPRIRSLARLPAGHEESVGFLFDDAGNVFKGGAGIVETNEGVVIPIIF